MAADICDAIYSLLSGNAPLAALLGTYQGKPAIFPDEAPKQLGSLAYIVCKHPSQADEFTMDGDASLASSRVQIDCVALDYPAAKSIRDAVRAVLQGFRGTVVTASNVGVTIQSCFLILQMAFITPSPSDETLRTYGRQMDFEIWHAPWSLGS